MSEPWETDPSAHELRCQGRRWQDYLLPFSFTWQWMKSGKLIRLTCERSWFYGRHFENDFLQIRYSNAFNGSFIQTKEARVNKMQTKVSKIQAR